MTSTALMIETTATTNSSNLDEFYSTYKTHSSSSNLSRSSSLSSVHSSSSSLSNKPHADSEIHKINSNSALSTNQRKDSALKLPYPVLSDHRDPALILVLLQKETQTTSKKISNVTKKVEDYERNIGLNSFTDNEKKSFKYERAKLKQQLDALKKHERRVNLQIDFITTKTEIKGLEDEQKQNQKNQNFDESQQIKILLGKLKQQLDKMKIYMRTRNEQMKKIVNAKQNLINSNNNNHSRKSSSSQRPLNSYSSGTKDLGRKRPSTSINNNHSNKRLKPAVPVVRLTSRVTSNDAKSHAIQPPVVRFVNKTTNSTSPTTPASSSSTLSPPTTTNLKIPLESNEIPLVDDDELDTELNIDELFNDDSCSRQLSEE